MTGFTEDLEARQAHIGSLLCVGLDAHEADLPASATMEDISAWYREMGALTSQYALAFKVNMAFWERFPAFETRAMSEVLQYLRSLGPLVILDGKRGDIGTTARAYVQGAFETYRVDAVTVAPYLGPDALEVYRESMEKGRRGVFLLAATTNPSAHVMQGQAVMGRTPATDMTDHVVRWGKEYPVGFVASARDPYRLAKVRRAAPDAWLLAPGVGAQGGNIADVVRYGVRDDGSGVLISVSRAITQADDPRAAAESYRDAIEEARSVHEPSSMPENPRKAYVACELVRRGMVKFGEFELRSGDSSPFYLDLRRLATNPALMTEVVSLMAEMVRGLEYDYLCPLPYAGIPLASALSLNLQRPMLYLRKERKAYGTQSLLEGGDWEKGQRALLVDDVVTTFGGLTDGKDTLAVEGLRVQDAVVIVDRSWRSFTGVQEDQFFPRTHALYTMMEIMEYAREAELVSQDQYDQVLQYLTGPNSLAEQTSLTNAIHAGDHALFDRLLELGVNLEERSPKGETPLIAAVKAHRLSMVKTLLEAGARRDGVDAEGHGPLYHAAMTGSWHLTAPLLALRTYGPPFCTVEDVQDAIRAVERWSGVVNQLEDSDDEEAYARFLADVAVLIKRPVEECVERRKEIPGLGTRFEYPSPRTDSFFSFREYSTICFALEEELAERTCLHVSKGKARPARVVRGKR